MKKQLRHDTRVIIGGGVVVLVIAALAYWQGGNFLGAKSTTPGIVLAQGETYTMKYTTSATVPTVKIEICRGTKCSTLVSKAPGTQRAVTVPRTYTLGAAYFKVSERNKAGVLTGKIQKTVAIIVVGAANPERDSESEDSDDTTATPVPTFSFTGGGLKLSSKPTVTPVPKPPVIEYKLKHVCIQERRGEIERSILVEWEPKTAILGYRFGTGDLSAKPWWYPSKTTGATIIPLLNGYYAQIPIYFYRTFEIQLKPASTIWRESVGSEIYKFDAGAEPLIIEGDPISPGSILPPGVTPSSARKCLYTNP